MRQCTVQEATHVKVSGGHVLRIKSKWGIGQNGELAKPSDGGFGVVTVDNVRVTMREALLYFREDDEQVSKPQI